MKRLALTLLLLAPGSVALAKTPVVVIGVDKKTLRELGPFGASYREHHAELVKRLNAAGVKGIAFAFTFGENPQAAAGTQALAEAAKASTAPVVIAADAKPATDGKPGEKGRPTASALQDPRIGTGHALVRPELLTGRFGAWGSVSTGEIGIVAEASGHRSLVEALMRKTTPLKAGDLERLSLVEDVQTGKSLLGDVSTTPLLRPQVTEKPLTLSFVDVLRKGPHPKLKGALVIVGINDGQQDLHTRPNPNRPKLKTVSGVFLHAALLQRLLREVPKRLEAERAKTDTASKSGPRRAGLSAHLEQAGKQPPSAE